MAVEAQAGVAVNHAMVGFHGRIDFILWSGGFGDLDRR